MLYFNKMNIFEKLTSPPQSSGVSMEFIFSPQQAAGN